MKCPNHPTDDLEKEDFYWHKYGERTLKNPLCKKCISEKNKSKYKKKTGYFKMFIG